VLNHAIQVLQFVALYFGASSQNLAHDRYSGAFALKTPPDRLSGATCGNVGEDGLCREMAS
jgi:hypothetical protein